MVCLLQPTIAKDNNTPVRHMLRFSFIVLFLLMLNFHINLLTEPQSNRSAC